MPPLYEGPNDYATERMPDCNYSLFCRIRESSLRVTSKFLDGTSSPQFCEGSPHINVINNDYAYTWNCFQAFPQQGKPLLRILPGPTREKLSQEPFVLTLLLYNKCKIKAILADPTGLEPAVSSVTGRRDNQFRYGSIMCQRWELNP